jgi:hypothetical protein
VDLHRIAEIVKGSSPAGAPAHVRLRQAEIIEVNEDDTVNITLAGAEPVIEGVVVFEDVTPIVGRSLWVLTDGVDLIGIGVT